MSSDLPRRKPHTAVLLAAVVWALCLATFALRIVIWRHGFPPWGLPFLAALAITGAFSTALLYGLSQSLRQSSTLMRWGGVATGVTLIALGQALVDDLVYRWLLERYEDRDFGSFNYDGVALNFTVYVWLFGVYALSLDLTAASFAAAENARQAASARALAHTAQLRALRLQLDPHFLFNTLNAISGLIVTRRLQEADLMMVKLAELLRSTLAAEGREFSTLEEELDLADAYLEIQRARFGDRLRVHVECPESLMSAQVPSLILQPLLENSVKYSAEPTEDAVAIEIRIAARDRLLVLEVEDERASSSTAQMAAPGAGIGLRNIRERLAASFGQGARLDTAQTATGFLATIRLPLSGTRPAEPLAMAREEG
jgi:hypothetical protein